MSNDDGDGDDGDCDDDENSFSCVFLEISLLCLCPVFQTPTMKGKPMLYPSRISVLWQFRSEQGREHNLKRMCCY